MRGADHAWTAMDALTLALPVYLLVHLVVTAVVFARASQEQVRAWAGGRRRGSLLQRYVLGTAPGPGASVLVAVGSLLVALVWLPGRIETHVSDSARTVVALVLVVVSWAATWVSFTVTYLADNVQEDEEALEFPGDEPVTWSDYIYFTLSVMTTFGTTDVTVLTSQMRRTVTVTAFIAFVFNTVIITAAVGAISP